MTLGRHKSHRQLDNLSNNTARFVEHFEILHLDTQRDPFETEYSSEMSYKTFISMILFSWKRWRNYIELEEQFQRFWQLLHFPLYWFQGNNFMKKIRLLLSLNKHYFYVEVS